MTKMNDLFTTLARFGVPSCGHVGDIFGRTRHLRIGPDKFRVPRPSQNPPKTPSRPNFHQKSTKNRLKIDK